MAGRSRAQSQSGDAGQPLSRYWSKRDFSVTSEPEGKGKSPAAASADRERLFVVQKHAATRLHYDFRLEWNGVLKSWAVTKGPSYFPGDKRLAVMVEDHPWAYRDFEGTIPKGQYGGGTVMVWDEGEWEPHGDVERGLSEGRLKFALHGIKLKGGWTLIRMNGGLGKKERPDRSNWLLIKEKDEFARESSAEEITEEAPDSAMSGRSMEQIAAANDRVWTSHGKDEDGARAGARDNGKSVAMSERARKQDYVPAKLDLKRFPREPFPGFVAPQLAQQTGTAPTGAQWLHELKFDGYRIQIHLQGTHKGRAKNLEARLLTRNGLDWTERMPDIAQAARALNVESAILDGEAVVLDERGVSNFADLQAVFHEGRQAYITYFAFDLLHLNGHDLRGASLEERKRILAGVVGPAAGSPFRLSEAIEGDGPLVYEHACSLGAEGIVFKLVSAPYSSGRNSAWLKAKCRLEQEFVIGGFTLPTKGTQGIGALLLGYYEKGKLRYAGRAGTGFTQATHRALRSKLESLAARESAFADAPLAARRAARWVRPELVAQISFSTWTRDDLVRQAAFKGLREDKPANEVVRESAQSASEVAAGRPAKPHGTKPARRRDAGSDDRNKMVQAAITHPEKVLDAESGLTKRDLADYLVAVAEYLLPQIADRPLSVVRCPEGNGKPCFFQKHIGAGLPQGVKSIAVRNRKTGEPEEYLTVDTTEGLVSLAQMGVLEIHPWGSRNESLDNPDRLVFDLDPDAAIAWKTLGETALELRKRLSAFALKSFLKSTGGKGLHVVVPLRAVHSWSDVKDFAHRLAIEMERARPDLYVTKMTKATRKNRIYLDYLRNDRGSTSVAAFSTRARPGAPVAMPLHWSELDLPQVPIFLARDYQNWKSRLVRDPWREWTKVDQKLMEQTGSPKGRARLRG